MITAIRDVRRARGLTLEEVGRRCDPPTTAQTIGRLETGARTVSVAWLNRIAGALGVEAGDLVTLPDRPEVPVAALLGPDGARAPTRPALSRAPTPRGDLVAVSVQASVGDYRAGDTLWCARLAPDAFGQALNRDVLAPRAGGRFVFGRLIACEGARLAILPVDAGARRQEVADATWIARADTLIRTL